MQLSIRARWSLASAGHLKYILQILERLEWIILLLGSLVARAPGRLR